MNAAVALLAAVCVCVLTGVALAFPCGGLNPTIALMSLAAGAIAGVLAYGSCKRKQGPGSTPPRKPGPWEWAVIAVYTLFSLRAFCWLVYFRGDSIQFLSDNNLGDLSLHLTFINNLANGVPFWPESPIFAGEKLPYPLGIDIFNSLLKLAGIDVYRGLVAVGLGACAVTGVALFRWGRGFAIAGFLFNGGLAGIQFFWNNKLADYQAELGWKSIPLAMFVTQRGLLYAIPAGLALLWSWRARFFPSEENKDRKPLPFWIEVLLYSTMPLFHLHTFVFLSLLLGCWIVVSFIRKNPVMEHTPTIPLLKLVGWAFIPATALTAMITGFFKSGSVIHLASVKSTSKSWDWMYGEQPEWAHTMGIASFPPALGHIACWAVNFGLFPLVIVALGYALIRSHDPASRRAAAFVFPAVLIFIFSWFVMLAPWDWDNTKIMIWPYLLLLPFLWEHLLAGRHVILRGAACVILYFSGFISLLGGIDGTHTGNGLATRSEVDEVGSAVESMPPTAIFAAYPTFNHPLSLNGRNVMMGYAGHLMSQGVDYQEREAQVGSLLNGNKNWRQIAAKFHVRYIFWGDREEDAYPDSLQPWKEECRMVAEGPWGEIYDISLPATPPMDTGSSGD